MLVFWWQGKGFYALLIVFGVGLALSLVRGATGLLPQDGPVFVAIVLAVSAAVTWHVGSRLNGWSRGRRPVIGVWKRLTYRTAAHKFLSLPVETSSVLMLIVAAWILVAGVYRGSGY